MYVLQRIPVVHYASALGLVLAGLLQPVQVNAAWTHAQGSNGWTVDWDGGRMQQTAQWVPATSTNAAGGASWAVSGGNLAGTANGRINNGPGYIDVQAKVIPTKPTVAGALARAAKRLGPLATGLAIVDLALDLGHVLTSGPDGSVQYQQVDPTVCTVAPCHQYRTTTNPDQVGVSPWHSSVGAACTWFGQGMNAWHATKGNGPYSYSVNGAGTGCLYAGTGISVLSQSVAPSPVSYLPSSEQAFIDAIALASGWPTSENFPKAIVQAIENGEQIPGPVTVTGPSTSQGSKTTTTDSSGNVTERQTVYNYNYSDNRVTYTTTTVTTVNNVVQSTEVKENEKPEEEDPCETNPDRASCAELDTPEGEVPKETQTITYAPEEMGLGAGACPADLVMSVMSHGGQSMKVWDWAQTCSKVTTYVRPLLLALASITALFLVVGYKPGGDTDGAAP